MREREQPHVGVARDLGGLARGRMHRLGGAVGLLVGEGRLVDEHVGALGEGANRLGRRGVAGDDDAASGSRCTDDRVRGEDAAVGERDRLAALQRAALGPVRDAERLGRLDVEAAGPLVLDERVADRRDAVLDREDEDAVAVALERLARAQLVDLDRVAELAEDAPERAVEVAQARRPVDGQPVCRAGAARRS